MEKLCRGGGGGISPPPPGTEEPPKGPVLIGLREESNAEETFARRQIREILGINFRGSPVLSFFSRINFRDLAATEKLNAV